MDYIISVLYLLIFIICSYFVSNFFLNAERSLARLTFTLTISLVGLMWYPALFAFLFDFTQLAIYSALGMAAVTGVFFYMYFRARSSSGKDNGIASFFSGFKSEKAAFIVVTPFFLFTMFLLHTHVLRTNSFGALESGQSTWGDMAMHLGFITSLSVQKTFPPNYNLISGDTPLGYPFLCDSVSSVFFTLTGDHRFSYLLPMVVAILAVFSAIFLFFDTWLGKKSKSSLATVLFLLGGGFGFAYFLDLTRSDSQNFLRIFSGFYTTPTNHTDKNILWVNPIADMLIPQRSTLFGWAVLIPCIYLLYRAAFQGEKRFFIPLGIMAGALPLINTHSFLTLAIISLVYFTRESVFSFTSKKGLPQLLSSILPWLIYAGIAAALSLPQLIGFTFKQALGDGFFRIHFNWVNSRDNYFWFYIKNMGLQYLLALPAFLYAERNFKWMYCGGLLALAISETFLFQPNPYDNNKIIFIWYLLNCGLIANLLIDMYNRLRDMGGIKVLAAVALVALNLSGVLTLGREAVSKYTLFSRSHLDAAKFIAENTSPNALFLTDKNHNNTVASLTGRNIFVGSSSFLYFHGISTWDREEALRDMLEYPKIQDFFTHGIDYVYVSDYERHGYNIDYGFFEENMEKVYNSDGITIYAVGNNKLKS